MKKKLIFSIIILTTITTISFLAKSQSPNSSDSINLSAFDMEPTGNGYSSSNTVLLSESAFITRFGAPSSSSTDYSEVDEANMNHYIYSGAQAWFMDNRLQALEFTSPDYNLVMSNGNSVKVGDPVSTLASMFPNSWAGRTLNQAFVALQNSQGQIDTNLLFEFDPNTGLITTISIQ